MTGGGQDFVRVYAEKVYGVPPEQVVGTALATKFGHAKDGKPELTKEPKLLFVDDHAGKPEGINLMIGRRPFAAFGNSTGDRDMLEWTAAGERRPARRCWCCTTMPRANTPTDPQRAFPTARSAPSRRRFMTRRMKSGWTVISMKNDWKRIFAFE